MQREPGSHHTNHYERRGSYILTCPARIGKGHFLCPEREIMYDYKEHIKSDILDYIHWNFTKDEIAEKLSDRDEWEQDLYYDLWANDSVTGNGSGSYYCNAYRAEKAIAHNWDILADAIEEFGGSPDVLRQGAEACDVTIRCYLLGGCVSDVLDDLETEAAQ